MINAFKRLVLWQCRVMQHIPGYRAYGRFLERHYTKHFWTTYIVSILVSIAINVGLIHLLNSWIAKDLPKDPEPIEPINADKTMRDLAASQWEGRNWLTYPTHNIDPEP